MWGMENDLAATKRAVIADRPTRERVRAYREQRRRERKCFWTWPFGHVEEVHWDSFSSSCAVCGKEMLGPD